MWYETATRTDDPAPDELGGNGKACPSAGTLHLRDASPGLKYSIASPPASLTSGFQPLILGPLLMHAGPDGQATVNP